MIKRLFMTFPKLASIHAISRFKARFGFAGLCPENGSEGYLGNARSVSEGFTEVRPMSAAIVGGVA